MTERRMGRRNVLRGMGGAVVGLPFLESLAPRRAEASAPQRVICWWHPDGTVQDQWWPSGGETNFTLNRISSVLEPVRNDVVIMRGVRHAAAAHFSGVAHQREPRAMLTGGGNTSLDQLLADKMGGGAFKSLEFGVGSQAGHEWAARMSYRSGTPLGPEANPFRMYARIFGGGAGAPVGDPAAQKAAAERLLRQRQSVLDAVRDQLSAVSKEVGREDAMLLDSHFTAIGDLEKSLRKLAEDAAAPMTCDAKAANPTSVPNSGKWHGTWTGGGIPNIDKVSKAQLDMMVLALRCNRTRVASVLFCRSNSGQYYPFLGTPSRDHHGLSHDGSRDHLRTIYRWYFGQFAYLLGELKKVREGDKTLLYNSTVLVVAEYGAGQSHSTDNLPVVLAGNAGGKLRTGRYLQFGNVSLTRLLTSVARLNGLQVDSVGDPKYGTGTLPGLA